MKINGNTSIAVFLTVLFSLIVIVLPGCSTGNRATPDASVFWHESSDGTIQTYDVARLQKVVPFTIVLPQYLPEEFKSDLPHLSKTTYDLAITIDIYYSERGVRGTIEIREDNSGSIWVPNDNLEYTYIDIVGIKVLEQKSSVSRWRSGQQVSDPELSYMWNHDNIGFQVIITNYDQTEARKIVESMINQ